MRTPERRQIYFEEMSLIFEGCNEVVFIPYASSNHIDYTARLSEFSAPSGIVLRNIDEFENPIAAIEQAEGLYVGGGNTFLLTQKVIGKTVRNHFMVTLILGNSIEWLQIIKS